jgi:small-conductance mechanosensitive channel
MAEFSPIDVTLPIIDLIIILNSILILVIAYISVRVISYLLTWFSERVGRYRLAVKNTIPIIKWIIYAFALYNIFGSILIFTSTQLLAIATLLGAAIGFGIKDLFADVIGGIVIILEKPYQVGDKIRIGQYYGEVVDIGIRSTRLMTPDDTLVSAPNYLIFTQTVASATAGNPEMMVIIDLFIDPSSDAELAMKILKEAVITSKYVYLPKKQRFAIFLDDFPFYRRLRAKAYVYDLRAEFEFKSDITRRAWVEFSKNGIQAPKVTILGEGVIKQ